MVSRWGSALTAACVGLFALIQAPVVAQVEWVTSLTLPDEKSGFVSQVDCLMPRLGASSPVLLPRPPASAPGQTAATSWWGRTQDWAGRLDARWTKVDAANGAIIARAPVPPSSVICGAPVTAEGGRVTVEERDNRRLTRYDAAGIMLWQTADATTPTTSWTPAAVVISANGDTTYAAGNRLRRVSASGIVLLDVLTNLTGVKYVAVNASGDTWIVANDSGTATTVSRFSAAGNQLWSTTTSGACIWETGAAVLTATDELLYVGFACNEARVVKIAMNGQVQWQRLVSGSEPRSKVRLSALTVDAAGNVYAAGCAEASYLYYASPNAWSVAASWSASGAERWSTTADVSGGISACSAALVLSGGGLLFVAAAADITTSSDSPGTSALWVLDTAGTEQWRHRGVLSNPPTTRPEMAMTTDGALIVLGDVAQTSPYIRFSTVRRINVASLGSTVKLKVLEVPASPIGYREAFAVRVGLRTTGDVATSRAVDTVVYLTLGAGTGRLGGATECIIPAGGSECTVAGVRYDKVESAVILSANADGFAVTASAPLGFRRADTTTTLFATSAAPFQAFTVIRVRAVVQGPPWADGHGTGVLNGPFSPVPGAISGCGWLSVEGSLTAVECDFLVHSTTMPLTASFTPYVSDNRYNGSGATPLTLPILKVQPTLDVSVDPFNTNVAGDRIRFRVAVMAPDGYNATPMLASNAVHVSGGHCVSVVTVGSIQTRYSGSYVLCEIADSNIGAVNLTFDFGGDDNLLPASPVTLGITIRDGSVLRGVLPSEVTARACSTSPGMVCTTTDSVPAEWQCVGPNPSTGQIYMVPTQPSLSYYFANMPFSFINFGGGAAYTYPNAFVTRSQPGSCKADVDGDGAVMAMTDGVLILRFMLGLDGNALVNAATHACVPLTPSQIAYRAYLPAYDLDGDGLVSASTDGLLLLRAMLGFRGDALVNGALGTAATRRTGSDVMTFLQADCGFALP